MNKKNELKSLEFYLNELKPNIKKIHYNGRKIDEEDLHQEMLLAVIESYYELKNGKYDENKNAVSYLKSRAYGALKDYLSKNSNEFSFSCYNQYLKNKSLVPKVSNSYKNVKPFISLDHENIEVNEILNKFDKNDIVKDRIWGLTFKEIGEKQNISASGVFQNLIKIKKKIINHYLKNDHEAIMFFLT